MDVPMTNLPDGGRIGVLADTHCERAGRSLPPAVFEAFAGVQLIVHLGDCGDPGALDALARVAPVCATRGGDDAAQDGRYADARVIAVGSVVIGALFDLARAGLAVDGGGLSAPAAGLAGAGIAGVFGRPVGVVLFAATHRALVAHHGGMLFARRRYGERVAPMHATELEPLPHPSWPWAGSADACALCGRGAAPGGRHASSAASTRRCSAAAPGRVDAFCDRRRWS